MYLKDCLNKNNKLKYWECEKEKKMQNLEIMLSLSANTLICKFAMILTLGLMITDNVIVQSLTQKWFSYLKSFIWNGLPDDIKLTEKVNTFKHKIKRSSWHYYGKKIKISMYTMDKLPPSSPHFNHLTIIQTEINNTNTNMDRITILCFNTTAFPLFKFKVFTLF